MALAGASPSQAPGRWSKIAPLFGLLFVLFVLASVLVGGNTPATNASQVSILHYYRTHKHQVGISALLIPPAVVFGLIWFSYLRNWLQRRDVDPRWGILTFAGGVLFAVTGGIAGGVLIALNDAPDHLTLSSAQTLNYLQSDMTSILGSMAFGLMAIAAGVAILKSAVLPTWLGWVSLVLGILGLLPFGDFFALPAIGVWTLILVGVIWFRSDPDGTLTPSKANDTPAQVIQ
jgi:hypothetical protein